MKRLCALLLAALLLLSGCAAGRPDGSLPTLTVTFLDVGKADCILLEAEGRAAMIDAGNQGDAEEILALLSAKGISSLDFLLLTHLDKDHIGGADALIESVPIGTIYAPDYDKGNKQYDQYIAALTAAGIDPVHPTEPVDLTLDHAGISESETDRLRVKLDYDDGVQEYEVTFYVGNREYDYDINAATGEIRSHDSEIDDDYVSSTEAAGAAVSEDEARATVVARVSGASASDVRLYLERDDGRLVYEGELIYNGTEYEFQIDATTGDVLDWESESVRD